MSALDLLSRLRLPLMCAPMSFASSLALTRACCEAGVVAGWQGGNVRTIEEFELHLQTLDQAKCEAEARGAPFGPHAINLPVAVVRDPELGAAKVDLCEAYCAPLIFSCLGDPSELVKRAHGWGGFVIHDAVSVRHAEKAIEAGVDGLMLTCAGAGGQTGGLTPFAFVPRVRKIYDGLLLVGGGVADGAGMAAALALGADLAVMGTRFIATDESAVVAGHKALIVEADMDDIIVSDRVNGIDGNWIRQSLQQAGLDPDNLPEKRGPRRGGELPAGVRPWRDIWSAGQSAGLVDQVVPVRELVERLAADFERQPMAQGWRERLGARLDRLRPTAEARA
jgi:nitronate monooxygenase